MSDKYSVTRTSWWVKNDGPDSDVVITSRVRLARNFDKYRFTHLANNEELDEIIRKISVCTNKATDFGQLHMTRMASLKPKHSCC